MASKLWIFFKLSTTPTGGGSTSEKYCLYRASIRSKLDYGCIVYGAASNNILKKVDPIHHQGLRIALGAFRTSPVASVYAKAQEMSLKNRRKKLSLKNRRKKLSMNYVLKLKTCPDTPAYSCVWTTKLKLFLKSSLTPPLGLRILPLLRIQRLTWIRLMIPQCQILFLGVNLNHKSVYL